MNPTDLLKEELSELMKLGQFKDLKIFVEGETAVLFMLYSHKKMTPKELSKVLGITKGRVTSLLNRLNEKKYIRISISSEDRRCFNVELTEAGMHELRPKMNRAEKHLKRVFEVLKEEKMNLLIELIHEMRTSLEAE